MRGGESTKARRPLRVRLPVLLLALVGGPLVAEGLLRWLLFSGSPLAERLGERFRDPSLYLASPNSEDQAKLMVLFRVGWRVRQGLPPCADAEIGWIKPEIDPATYRHADEAGLEGHRPVLLYGSSFAACNGHDQPCFEELLAGSELGWKYRLLNYAVTGHGMDQSLLLLRRSIEHYAAQNPVVVVALVLEADLDRATLSFFTRPKPRFRSQGDAFVLEPPADLDILRFLEHRPPTIRSYFLRYLANGVGLLPLELRRSWEGETERQAERLKVTAFLLRELGRECSERGLEHFVLLFHMKNTLASPQPAPEAEFHALLADADLSWVDTRVDVERALAEGGCTLDELFGTTSHPSGLGTAVMFEGLARGLRCEYDGRGGN